MLDMTRTQQMTDIIHASILYSGIEDAVISTPIFNRLHRVLQSSLVFLTYPSNKVKRFEHSIGTMYLSGEIYYNSLCNASEENFYIFLERISSEIKSWREQVNFNEFSFVPVGLRTKFQGENILNAPIPNSSFYNKYYLKRLNESQEFAYYVGLQSIRLAGLLHDVGHLPYSHILENALKKMYHSIKEKEKLSSVEETFINIMEKFAIGDDEIHEEIGKLLVYNIRDSITQNIKDIHNEEEIYFFLLSFHFASKIISSKFSDETIFSDLHLITSSVVDADRLDYCSRDLFCSGINSSPILYRRLLSTYRLEFKSEENDEDSNKRFYFCPSIKSISIVENLLTRRYEIFSEINYHHRVHKHELLLEEVICLLGLSELEEMSSIKHLQHTLPLSISGIWQLIEKLNLSNDWPEYQIIQLDDSWLDTVLKHNFFKKYGENYLSLRDNANDVLWNKFDELISSTKRYFSLIKRSDDFQLFDKLFFDQLKPLYNKVSSFFIDELPDFSTYNEFCDKYKSFVFNYFIEKLYATENYRDRFFKKFEETVNRNIKESNIGINDCLLKPCLFSLGCNTAKTPLFLSDGDKPLVFEKISSLFENLRNQRAFSPIFHVYYLSKYNFQYNTYEFLKTDDIYKILAKSAVETLLESN